ncbi:MAG: alpha/beta hydrolase [Fimbriimonas sp.]
MQYIFRPATDQTIGQVLLLLHGTGGDEHSLVALGEALLPGAALLGVRGSVREGTANRFFRRLEEGVFDLDDVVVRAKELADFLDQTLPQLGLVPSQLTAVGFSNGANMATLMMLLQLEHLQSAIAIRGQTVLLPDPMPDLTGSRLLLLSGEFDPLVPVTDAKNLATTMAAHGAEVTHEVLLSGHNLTQADFEIAKAWLAQKTQA